MPLIFINDEFKPTSYTYTDGTLSIDIQNWAALSEFQVVVTGIDPSKYQLKCTNLMQYITFSVTSKTVTSGNVTFDRYVNGFPNADGAAFYFRTAK